MRALTNTQLITLQRLNGIGNKAIIRIKDILENKGISLQTPSELADFLTYAKENGIAPKLKDCSLDTIKECLSVAYRIEEECARQGISIISLLDDNYPKQLLKTIDESGNISIPTILYYIGDLRVASLPGIAIVGTREPTEEGARMAEFFASEFASRGFNIVSGLALGCDTCAHRGALRVGGKTTAFLGHGLNTIYPPQNEELAKSIIEQGGLLMSEYSIDTRLTSYNLVARDRLQSSLAKATLVVQTGEHGGTMHAVRTTLAANKPLFAVKYANKGQEEQALDNKFLVDNYEAVYLERDFFKSTLSLNEYYNNVRMKAKKKPEQLEINF